MNNNENTSSEIDQKSSYDIDDLVIGDNFFFIKENSISYQGQIVNKYENHFAVSIFCGQPNYSSLDVNETVQFIIATKNSAFKCTSTVLGCTLEDGFQLAVLTIPEIITKIERRIHKRIPIVLPVSYYIFPKLTKYASIKQVSAIYFNKMKKTTSIDISNNGIKIITDSEITPSSNAIISLNIGEKIDILASVVRVDFDQLNNEYKTAFEFKDMDKNKQEILDNFLNDKLNDI